MSADYPPNFKPKELNCRSGAECPYPDRLRHLAWTLQTIREAYGKPIRVNSAYRSPEHNKKVGGARNSQHIQAMAADLAPVSGTEFDLNRLIAVISGLAATGKIPNGGIGTYSTFIHYDMRPDGPARWRG